MQESRPLRSTRRLSNQAWARPKWYTISNSAAGAPAQVTIYDEIGFYGVAAGQFMADIDGITGDIEMHINSPGGDIYDGLTIYNRLKQRKGSIHVVVDGLAASAASFIAMAASPGRLEMAPRSELMIHNGFAMVIGDAADLRKTADQIDRKTADIAGIYAERSGKPADYWLAKMAAETWFSAQEAVAEGLADRIQGQPVSNDWDLSVYAHWRNADGNHAPMTGSHTHSHPDGRGGAHSHEHSHDGDAMHGEHDHDPDHDGDDDSSPSGDTDHDYAGASNRLRNVKKPHGDVPYADPGYLDANGEQVSKSGKEGVARYPVDAEHVQAAWSYINQEDNASQYTPEQLASIKTKIKKAMKQHGHEVSKENLTDTEIWAALADPALFQLAGEE